MYRYLECGLTNIWLGNGYNVIDTPHGRAVSVDDVDGLHERIGMVLADSPNPLTRQEFRFLRHELLLSQLALATLIGTQEQNVSNWERGRVGIPPAVDRTLRALYVEHATGSVQFKHMLEVLSARTGRALDKLQFEQDNGHWQVAA